ncbi:unnamed protein product, partial [Meganyctiphanes norvegica]
MAAPQQSKKKCRQYNAEYIQHGFVPSPSNQQHHMCLLCGKMFSNVAMQPSRLREHLHRVHPSEADKGVAYFQSLYDKQKKKIYWQYFVPRLCGPGPKAIPGFLLVNFRPG